MEANNFVAKLKADDSGDIVFENALKEYTDIAEKLKREDVSLFALNVLCMICRNLEKAPNWSRNIDKKDLLTFVIKSLEDTTTLQGMQSAKTLACVFHLHKHAVKMNVSPSMVFKLSDHPFVSRKSLQKKHCKTYWTLLYDKMNYMEMLKSSRIKISQHQKKITEQISVIIDLYDTVTFCIDVLPVFVKKIHALFNDRENRELDCTYEAVFSCLLGKNDYKKKTIPESMLIDVYKKVCNCFSLIFEDSLKNGSKNSALSTAVKFSLSFFEDSKGISHCLRTFYMSYCHIVTDVKSDFVVTVLKQTTDSCEETEKLKYDNIMLTTYPFVSQILRTYIEYIVTCDSVEQFFIDVCEQSLILMGFLMKKLTACEQLVQCNNCKLKSGTHDSIRLSFLGRQLITAMVERKIDCKHLHRNILEFYELQRHLLSDLRNCANYDKCFTKSQTDMHNTAILLNKFKYHELSNSLFDVYLKSEMKHFVRTGGNAKSLSRGFYNKAICQLDFKMHDDALKSAFLAVVFSDMCNDNNINLVINVKSKALTERNPNIDADKLQLISILDVCRMYRDVEFGFYVHYFGTLDFSALLKFEFSHYAKLWPSVMPIAGVWNSYLDLLSRIDKDWIKVQQHDNLLWTASEVILETACSVQTIHFDVYRKALTRLLDEFFIKIPKTSKFRMMHATLLFLKSEFDIEEISLKHQWNNSLDVKDQDAMTSRTLSQEHAAIQRAIEAVEVFKEVLPALRNDKLEGDWWKHAIEIIQVSCLRLLNLDRLVQGLQLCHMLCQISKIRNDIPRYQMNLGLLLYNVSSKSKEIDLYLEDFNTLLHSTDNMESTLIFACQFAIYSARCKDLTTAAKLVHYVQLKLLTCGTFDDACERVSCYLTEAQAQLFKDQPVNYLSLISTAYKQCLATRSMGDSWSTRRANVLMSNHHSMSAILACVRTCQNMQLWRRANVSATAALARGSATLSARTYAALTNTHLADNAQVKIDNRLKHILGLQPTNDIQDNLTKDSSTENTTKLEPKSNQLKTEIESVMDVSLFLKKTHARPSSPCLNVPGFRIPDFLFHSKDCSCFACDMPQCSLIFLKTCGLEASVYFRSKEFLIAENYFSGTLKLFAVVEEKLSNFVQKYATGFEMYIIDGVKDRLFREMFEIQLEILIENAFFELVKKNYSRVDELIFEIKDKISNIDDAHLNTEFMNLMATSAYLRREVKQKMELKTELTIDKEMANLNLSSGHEQVKTPENKVPNPVKETKKTVTINEEDIPIIKRRLKKLNLEELSPEKENVVKSESKTNNFSIPVPKTSKAVPEIITPRPTRSKPDIVVTSHCSPTPKAKDLEFSTPLSKPDHSEYATPTDMFFTPMTSVKTYQSKTLRNQIVKNLRDEFKTPKTATKSTKKDSIKAPKDKKTLKRATSPGKLEKRETRSVVNTRKFRTEIDFSPEAETLKPRGRSK